MSNVPARMRARFRQRRAVLGAILSGLLVALTLGGATVQGSTSGGCDLARQCRSSGYGVDAAASTLKGDLTSGVVYFDTYLSAGLSSTSGSAGSSTSAFACLDQYSYSIDNDGNWIQVADRFGCANPGDVQLTVASSLSSATLTATLQLQTCTYDAQGVGTCTDPAPAALVGTWAASGPRSSNVSTFHEKYPGTTYTSTFQGSTRSASATVTLASASLFGSVLSADITNSRSNNVSICHGPTC